MTINRIVLATEVIEIARNDEGVVVTATNFNVEDVYSTRYFDDLGNDIADSLLRKQIDEAIAQRDYA